VTKSKKKPLIGIIGGIGSGKSTVAAEFRKLGCALIDADAIARELLAEPHIHAAVVERFGPTILDAAGAIDRHRLAERAFADGKELAALNAIVHPPVLRQVEALIAQYEAAETVPAIVLDIPLLVEVGWAERCDRIVFVDSRWERRIERAGRKGRLTQDDIKIRENSQISLDTKAALADNTIDNNSDFSALVRQIQDIFSDITKNS
jgi:dephospho-CoA kinase